MINTLNDYAVGRRMARSEYDQKECFMHHACWVLFNYDCNSYVPKTSSKPEWPARSRNGEPAEIMHDARIKLLLWIGLLLSIVDIDWCR